MQELRFYETSGHKQTDRQTSSGRGLAAFRILGIATVRFGVATRLSLQLRAIRAHGLASRIILVLLTTNSGVEFLAVYILGFLEDGSSRSSVGHSDGLGGRSGTVASSIETRPPTMETEGEKGVHWFRTCQGALRGVSQ